MTDCHQRTVKGQASQPASHNISVTQASQPASQPASHNISVTQASQQANQSFHMGSLAFTKNKVLYFSLRPKNWFKS